MDLTILSALRKKRGLYTFLQEQLLPPNARTKHRQSEEEIIDAWSTRLAECLSIIIYRGYDSYHGKPSQNWTEWVSGIAERLNGRSKDEQKHFINDVDRREIFLRYEIANFMRGMIKAERNGEINEDAMQELLEHKIHSLMGFDTQAGKDKSVFYGAVKVIRAADDLNTISNNGTQPKLNNAWNRLDWDIRPISEAQEYSTLCAEASSAIANIAQNIVLLANANPEIATLSKVQEGIAAAETLADISAEWTYKKLESDIADGLKEALRQSDVALKDKVGNPVNVDDYLSNRFALINKAIEERIAYNQNHKPGKHAQKLKNAEDKKIERS